MSLPIRERTKRHAFVAFELISMMQLCIAISGNFVGIIISCDVMTKFEYRHVNVFGYA